MTLIEIAKELLESKKVSAVIGYAAGTIPGKTQTIIAVTPQQAEKLVFDKYSFNNLAVYLTNSYKLIKDKPVAIMAKPCDIKSIIALMQENQIKREDIYIIGLTCTGVYDEIGLAQKCEFCIVHNPPIYDVVVGQPVEEKITDTSKRFEDVERIEKMSVEERWEFWQNEFNKCVKCYACRQACPLCYCEQCVVDKTQPRWIDSSTHALGNMGWHLIRAFHLTGRCIGCNECERVCHQNIPLGLLNKKMAKEIFEQYDYAAGIDVNSKPPLVNYKADDNQDFIR